MGCVNGTALQQSDEVNFCFSQRYELGERLSNGSFGQVYACRSRSAASRDPPVTTAAVKVTNLRMPWHDVWGNSVSIVDERRLRALREEVSIWRKICGTGGHPNCVQFIGACIENQAFYMVMERCRRSLMDCFEKLQCAPFPDLSRTLYNMLLGVAHIHRMGVIHRDIKLNNFLQSWDSSMVKLCDFGLATRMPKKGVLKDQCGTAAYMSPEMLGDKGYTSKTDVWSLGVSSYVLVFGILPYVPIEHGVEAMKAAILLGHPKPSFCSQAAVESVMDTKIGELVRSLLSRSPKTRNSAGNAVQFLSDVVQLEMSHRIHEEKLREDSAESISTCDGSGSVRSVGSPRQVPHGGHMIDVTTRADSRIIESL